MASLVKRARQELEFPFKKLPHELQEMILDKLDLETSLKLLQVDTDLPGFILRHGPYGRTLQCEVSFDRQFVHVEDRKFVLKPSLYYLFARVRCCERLRLWGIKGNKDIDLIIRIFPKLRHLLHANVLDMDLYLGDFLQKSRILIEKCFAMEWFECSQVGDWSDMLRTNFCDCKMIKEMHPWFLIEYWDILAENRRSERISVIVYDEMDFERENIEWNRSLIRKIIDIIYSKGLPAANGSKFVLEIEIFDGIYTALAILSLILGKTPLSPSGNQESNGNSIRFRLNNAQNQPIFVNIEDLVNRKPRFVHLKFGVLPFS